VLALLFALSTLATAAAVNHGWIAGASLGLLSAVVGLLIYAECSLAMSYWRRAFEQYVGGDATKHMMSPTAPNNRYIPACIQFRFRNFAVGRSSVQRGANALDRGILGHVGRTAHRSDDAVVGYQHTKDSMLPHRHL